jgi:hypothetical protein
MNTTQQYIACEKCANEWKKEIDACEANNINYEKHFKIDLSKYNNGYIYNGVFAIKALKILNLNDSNRCRICEKEIRNNSLIGGNDFLYHSSCFYSHFGHID